MTGFPVDVDWLIDGGGVVAGGALGSGDNGVVAGDPGTIELGC